MVRKPRSWALLLALCAAAGGCASLEPLPEGVDGVWEARRPGGGDEVRLDMYLGPMGRRTTEHRHLWFDVGEVEGLDGSAFHGSGPLTFTLTRDAGTFRFDGAKKRRPRGSFTFEPSAEYLERVAEIGVEEIDRDVLLMLALHGVSEGLVEALLRGGYHDTDAQSLFRLEANRLRPDWVLGMSRLAGPPSFEELIRLRSYGVNVHHVDAWVAAGIEGLPVQDLLRLYTNGFDAPDGALYIELGYDDVEDWLRFHRNGVPNDLIVAITESDGPRLDATGVIELYVQGVGAADVRGAAKLLEGGFDWDELVFMWRRGVSTEFAETLTKSGWDRLDADSITRLNRNGLSTDWVLRVRAAGGGNLDVDGLIELRHYGVGASDYEGYAAAGFTAVDDIRRFVSAGVDSAWVERVRAYLPEGLDSDELIRLRQHDVDPPFLQRLADAGFKDLGVEEIVEAREAGLDRWLARRQD